MKLIWSAIFLINTDGVCIREGSGSDAGVIPAGLEIETVIVEPASEGDTIAVCGIMQGSAWIDQKVGKGFTVDGITSEDRRFIQVRAKENTVVLNLYVKGK